MSPPAISTERLRVAIIVATPLEAESLGTRLGAEPDLDPVVIPGPPRLAVERVHTFSPDVVLIDSSLFADAAAGAIRWLRSRPRAPQVLALLPEPTAESSVRLIEAGAIAIVLRTASSAELVDGIRLAADGIGWLSPRLLRPLLAHLVARRHVATDHRIASLSAREREVLQLMVEGLDRRQIADRLYVSVETIRTHCRGVTRKLGVESTIAATAVARAAGMLPDEGSAIAS